LLTLADVFEALTGTRPAHSSRVISEAAVDSRQVIPAGMFVALPGERTDGHEYVADAFQNGAFLAIVQKDMRDQFPTLDLRNQPIVSSLTIPNRPVCLLVDDSLKALQDIARFWRSKVNVKIIGITGTIGKSTTKELITEVVSQRFRTLKSKGNLNNEIGLPLTILRLGMGYERAVLEMGFYYPGEIRFLCELAKPSIGVITNVGPTHASRAGSVEEIAKGKAELIETLPEDGVAILNIDDPIVRSMADKTKARVFFYGLDPDADLWASHIEGLGLDGIRFQLHHRNEILHLRVPLLGRHSVHTALRAAAVGIAEGMEWHDIVTGLQHGHNQLRLVAVNTQSGALILDDSYNSNPDSAVAALNLLQDMEGNKIAVLGDMLELGPYERQGHIRVGERVAQVCDQLIAVGQRSQIIAESARYSGMKPDQIHWFEDVPPVIDYLKTRLTRGDVALVKGSLGMAMSRIVNALEETHD
jgi:UDP-N-acetylmuramoyl-tripeptide--D-alanyl-D-alanine ligase